MTIIAGNIQDIGYQPLSGTLTATSVDFRDAGGTLIAPESRSWPIVAGAVSVALLPGPARLTIQVGSHARDEWDVIVPDSDVELATLIADSIEWAPPVVSIVGEHRRAAEAAADRAETAAGDVDAAIAGAADTVVAAVEQDRVAAETAATSAAGSASAASGSASAADGSASDAAGSATGAATSAGAASSSATTAGGHATTATTQAGIASTAAGTATTRAGEAAGSATAASTSAGVAQGHAEDAELWATSFGLTATATTGAPGTQAAVTVTGTGPEYGLSLTVPRGDKGPKGDDGEVSQAALDAAVATLVDNAPEALNTLSELATSLGNDPNFATTVSTEIGKRVLIDGAPAVYNTLGKLVAALQNHELGGSTDASLLTGALTSQVDVSDAVADAIHPLTEDPLGSLSMALLAGYAMYAVMELDGKSPTSHTHTKADVGLANVDNTSDANKPVSTAQQAAINAKIQLVSTFPASPTTGVLYLKAE